MASSSTLSKAFSRRLGVYYARFTIAFVIFVLALAVLEQLGLPRVWIGYVFMIATISLYAAIGVMSRTADLNEYYVAGRRVPALFNGMAVAADWISSASFLALAGTLYAQGFDALAFIMGWTGGYCLVAIFLAPYLRKFGHFTIPDFLGTRYGNAARLFGIIATILVSFVYIVAQIYGVGLITARFTGVDFGVGVFIGLIGILVCSFLGGMRAVTWTQVAQYIILLFAYLIPVIWLSVRLTGVPIPQLVYGTVLEKVTAREKVLAVDPGEVAVRNVFKNNAADAQKRIDNLPDSWQKGRAALQKRVEELRDENAPPSKIKILEKSLVEYPVSPEDAALVWRAEIDTNTARAQLPVPMAEPFYSAKTGEAGDKERNDKRNNFMALIFCLMIGTAALPHMLTRFYTTPSVAEARESVGWSLFFIFLVFFTVPALAVLVKFDVYSLVVGRSYADLPTWVTAWSRVDPGLLSLVDINHDGIVQLAEIRIGTDIIALATPEIASLPYVVTGLVAAGGLAAALSTADGLLLTISNSLSHDLYYNMINPDASTTRRMTISKALLVLVAGLAAWFTLQRPGNILSLVGFAFSLAASALFPALVLGVFWARANKWGAIFGMIVGLGVCLFYQISTYSFFTLRTGWRIDPWFNINPISGGIFGMPAGLITMVVVSLLTPAPDRKIRHLVEYIRYPNLKHKVA